MLLSGKGNIKMFGRIVVKYLLFSINLLCLITGLSIIYKAILLKLQYSELFHYIPELIIIPYAIVGLGGFISLISFSGCCGSITENKCLLISYAAILVVLAVAKLCVAGYVFIYLAKFRKAIHDIASRVLDDSTSFNVIELLLQCCGSNSPQSYGWSSLSSSCCGKVFGSCDQEDAYPIGCMPAIHQFYVDGTTYTGVVTGVIIFIEMMAVAATIFMVKKKSSKIGKEDMENDMIKRKKLSI